MFFSLCIYYTQNSIKVKIFLFINKILYYIKPEEYNMKTKSQNAFTLIELMIVVSIIGILSSIALPAYQNYIIRAKVSEGLALASTAKTSIAENSANGSEFASGWTAPNATDNVSTNPNPTKEDKVSNFSSGVSIGENGVITITYTNKIALGSPTLKLIPVANGDLLPIGTPLESGAINWECHSDTIPKNSALTGENKILGTIESKYVPANCRE
jgi:type IV pilus assembly protein PilA